MKKHLALILGCLMGVSLFACSNNEDPVEQADIPNAIELVEYDEGDSKVLDIALKPLINKLIDAGKEKAIDYAKNTAKKYGTKLGTLVKDEVFSWMGISTDVQQALTIDDIYKQVQKLSESMNTLQQEIATAQKLTNDNAYLAMYNKYSTQVSLIISKTKSNFKILQDINGQDFEDPYFSQEQYNASLASLDTSIRGSKALSEQTDIFTESYTLGQIILGDKDAAILSDVNAASMFDVVKYYSTSKYCFDNQCDEIETAYFSLINQYYTIAYTLVDFDIRYNLDKLNVGAFYKAEDGKIIAFDYYPDRTKDEKVVYFNALSGNTTALKTTYAKSFSTLGLNVDAMLSTGELSEYADINHLLSQAELSVEQQTEVASAYLKALRNPSSTSFKLLTNNNKPYDQTLSVVNLGTYCNTKTGSINFSIIKNSSKDIFNTFITAIKNYAGDSTIYDYLKSCGFALPDTDNHLLLIGVSKGDTKTGNMGAYMIDYSLKLTCVDLNTKVKDFNDTYIELECYYRALLERTIGNWAGFEYQYYNTNKNVSWKRITKSMCVRDNKMQNYNNCFENANNTMTMIYWASLASKNSPTTSTAFSNLPSSLT